MKLQNLTEQEYQIVGIEREENITTGTSKQGTIDVNYHTLVELFGEPKSFVDDPKSDINYEWELSIRYKDVDSTDEDYDIVDVSVYDKRYGDEDRYTNPTTINEWTVGAKNRYGLWVLMDYLNHYKK